MDLLLHAATREDIAKLDSKTDSKFDFVMAEMKLANEAIKIKINQ